MTSGVAWSARVSVSRDLLMSQFWQNLQARLQPAVPKESTGVPGRKWFSCFFSMGSTQKPLDRPQVVSTIWSSWRARTKQSPRCPSSSLQNRGQTSHWMRPLSSACQYFVGTVSPVMGASLLMLPKETDGRGVGIPLTPRRPPVFRYCPLKRPYCPPEWRHRPPVFHRGPAKSPSCPLPGRHRPPVVRAAPPPF